MKKEKTHRDIGVDASPPKSSCTDVKCPWHGKLPIRGRIFTGKVISDKAAKTVVIEWGYHQFIPKYERYERRRTRLVAYSPVCVNAAVGDDVRIAECRPLSKTKHFVVIEKVSK